MNETPTRNGPYLWIGIRWLIAIVSCIIVSTSLTRSAPLPTVSLGPPQTVITNNPKLGIHTRLTDEVESWKIKHTLRMVREMGAPWIVEYFPWAYHERIPGFFDWQHSDLVIQHANQQGLTVIARLGFVPEWARPTETSSSFLAPDRYTDFGDYVYAFVERYQNQVDYIIIWNEPNLALEWGFQQVDPIGYTNLLQIAYQRAKEANPDIQVLGGALAPTLAPPGDPFALDDLIYLRQMLEAGAGEVMDGLAVHSYGWVFPADDEPAPDVVNFRRTELVYALMERYGYGHLPLHITEGGWNDHPRWTRAVKPGQRIAYTLRAYEMANEWPWLASMNLWAFRYPWPAKTYLDYFSFVTPEFVPKPIYLEVKSHATQQE
ncbi:MAG: hypothetical protein AAF629_24445 [Chloroflexota bacterium]